MTEKGQTTDNLRDLDREADSRTLSQLLAMFGVFFFGLVAILYFSPLYGPAARKGVDSPKGKYYMPKSPTTSGLRSFLEPFK